MSIQPLIYKLSGKVQHYAWGGYSALPQLLNRDNSAQKPFAEYWLGAHPLHSSMVETGGVEKPLAELMNEDKDTFLGERVLRRFSSFPFLLKVLDVRQMLSIQVHPSKAAAEKAIAA